MKSTIVNTSSGVFIPCVSSYEKPVVSIMSYEESKQEKTQESSMMIEAARQSNNSEAPKGVEAVNAPSSSTMRYRTIPVYGEVFKSRVMAVGCVPAAFGNAICSYILHSLSHKSFLYLSECFSFQIGRARSCPYRKMCC